MDDSDPPLEDFALYLAYLRWRNKRRSKRGTQDEPSARARALWFKHKAISLQGAVIVEAAQELSGIADNDLHRLQRLWILEQLRRERTVKLGRSRNGPSLMALAMQRAHGKRPGGRPRIGAPEDAAKWVAYIFGLKLALFIERLGGVSGSTPESALDTLNRAARNDALEAARYLNREVTDREALANQHASTFGPPAAPPAMAKRLQRARQMHPFLPKQLKRSKSG